MTKKTVINNKPGFSLYINKSDDPAMDNPSEFISPKHITI